MGKAEGAIEDYLDDEVRKRGGFTRKYTSPGKRGVPDRIVFWKGVVFIEVKAPGEEPSIQQLLEITRCRKMGAVVITVESKKEVDDFIEIRETRRD